MSCCPPKILTDTARVLREYIGRFRKSVEMTVVIVFVIRMCLLNGK